VVKKAGASDTCVQDRLAKSELYFNRFITLDELVQNIDKVSSKQVKAFAADFFDNNRFSEAILFPENG